MDTVGHDQNVMTFELYREYIEDIKALAYGKLGELDTRVIVTITLLHNGFFNFLVEEKGRKR